MANLNQGSEQIVGVRRFRRLLFLTQTLCYFGAFYVLQLPTWFLAIPTVAVVLWAIIEDD